jgi:hypothetical protein
MPAPRRSLRQWYFRLKRQLTTLRQWRVAQLCFWMAVVAWVVWFVNLDSGDGRMAVVHCPGK